MPSIRDRRGRHHWLLIDSASPVVPVRLAKPISVPSLPPEALRRKGSPAAAPETRANPAKPCRGIRGPLWVDSELAANLPNRSRRVHLADRVRVPGEILVRLARASAHANRSGPAMYAS